jgi:hypothetical protein
MQNNIVSRLLQTKNELENKLLSTDSSQLGPSELILKQKALLKKRKTLNDNPNLIEGIELELKKIEDSLKTLNLKDFKTDNVVDQDDKDLIQLANAFLDMSDEDQKKLFIGDGAFKDTFDLPSTGLVLKKSGGLVGTDGNIIRDYAVNKAMQDSFGKGVIDEKDLPWAEQILERPKLITIPERPPVLIQKKLLNPDTKYYNKMKENPDNLKQQLIKNIKEKLKPDYIPTDIEGFQNIGFDPDLEVPKIFDAQGSKSQLIAIDNMTDKLQKAAYKLSKPKVYRSILPTFIKGAATAAGGLASLAAEASDITEEGSSREEAAMQREMQEDKLKKAIGEDAYYASKQNMRNTSPMDLLDPMAGRPQFRNLRNKIK